MTESVILEESSSWTELPGQPEQRTGGLERLTDMESDNLGPAGALRSPSLARPPCPVTVTSASTASASTASSAAAVESLYQAHALRLIRLAYITLGDRAAAEDVVQDAFCGLYRRWDHLAETGKALPYVRASVLNGCRSVLRHRAVLRRRIAHEVTQESAEAAMLSGEERHELIRAVADLPDRQREALVLRFYLDLPDDEIARMMGVRPSTVRSTMHRAIESLGKVMKERP
jgi:RNA polymerase sigma-70 factor (sigma-E family)